MMKKLGDLLFVIGLFLTIVGSLVFLTGIVSGNDLVQGVRVNIVGGGMMTVIGVAMIIRSYLVKA